MKKLFLFTALTSFSISVFAQTKKPTTGNQSFAKIPLEQIKKMCNDDGPRLVEIYKDLHANPELSFMEVRTASIVAKELRVLGYEVIENIGGTGVAGILKNGDGPVVMYRADMDALAVLEATNLPYKSTKKMKNEDGKEVPVMHACGHDAHVTWMLGVAKHMVTLKDKWKGTLVFIGQPAEENGFGAIEMSKEMYKKGVPTPNYLLGMHTGPAPIGMYQCQKGERMAGAVQLDVTFFGIGGHGSTPEQTIDPIVMAANAIIQYQTIISRNINPQHPAVLTVGAVEAGIDNNVIPDKALLKLNLRWYKKEDRDLMIEKIKIINEGIARANGLQLDKYPTLKIKQDLGVLHNNDTFTDKINSALEKIAGKGTNFETPPVMGSEDVHELLRDYPNVPYCYFIVGIANKDLFQKSLKEGKMFPFSNHNPDFWVDLEAIPFGTQLGLAAVLEAFYK